ncbi:MAG: DUF1015 family protein [Spirochaetaceae bacterium]|jgi:hypothetical protein|nr:DUF1015 family protein [Spirochaetaceae bacterium]
MMKNYPARLADFGITMPEISLPAQTVNLEKWAVIACDQYTQDKEFWRRCAETVGSAPSTLNIIFPEVYLGDEDADSRIMAIHKTMRSYIEPEYTPRAILAPSRHAGVFIERETESGTRRGFLMCIDLEKYDWRKGSASLIRSSEETIEERLPPRVIIRNGAPLECPHILLLIDDAENMLMSLFEKLLRGAPYVYETALANGAGSVRGRFVFRMNDWAFIADAITFLHRQSITRYGEDRGFIFAVGDGNHSLAAAKAVWEQYKTEHIGDKNVMNHNARYALVEIVNLYDNALRFEPIHRVFYGMDIKTLRAALMKTGIFTEENTANSEELARLVKDSSASGMRFGLFSNESRVLLKTSGNGVAAAVLEPILQSVIKTAREEGRTLSIDYIHGVDELIKLINSDSNTTGIIMPPFRKEGLFGCIAENGPLPRKSFSMGSALEKRFYLECRKLFW